MYVMCVVRVMYVMYVSLRCVPMLCIYVMFVCVDCMLLCLIDVMSVCTHVVLAGLYTWSVCM